MYDVEITMFDNLLIGLLVMLVCLILQSLLAAMVVQFYGFYHDPNRQSFVQKFFILAVVMAILVLGNFLQVGIWAWLFVSMGEFTDFSVAIYHSAVNFSTLGYGDIVMSEEHRLLGPLQAINGVLMIGVSTAIVMAALQQALAGYKRKRG